MLGLGQRPLGCTTLITAEMDSILDSVLSREEEGGGQAARLGQAACLNFVIAAAREAQSSHRNQAGCWGAKALGEMWSSPAAAGSSRQAAPATSTTPSREGGWRRATPLT